MENRGQKRPEIPEELPADKRACCSLEFRPSSSSNSPVQTQINTVNLTPETHTGDMETTSSSSASSQSEEEPEKDSADGSCDSEGVGDGVGNKHISLRDYQRRRSVGGQGKIKRIVSSLSEESDESGQLAALTELCEVLSFCTEDSISTLMSDSLSTVLVKLANCKTNPDIMLLAIRAITYMCDVYPRASGFLVRHNAVSALCQRLMAIEYLDVAEQCLQALDKISRDQPLACLQSGAIMAALTFIDFFSTSIQRVALSIVVNICKKLPSECPSPFMEAVPVLCNLLQYEDRQLVENVAICLNQIADRVGQSPEMLDELCKHGLIHQATHLIDLNSRTTLGQTIHTGLIVLLVKLASGSFTAVRTLFELNISSILKGILSSYELSHGMPSPHMADGHSNQVHEVLKLLNELLPTLARGDQDVQLALDKESFFVNQPDLLQKCGMDILAKLIQVVDSGANLYVCYGCLSIINKLVYFSKPDLLLELLKNINISSFLAGVLTRKDHHVLILALEITEAVLQKFPDYFLNSFIKEGVLFAVGALITPGKCSHLIFPLFCGTQLSIDPTQKSASKEVPRCLCYASDTGDLASKTGNCKLENDSVQNLAKRIWTNYFSAESHNPEKGLTDIFHKLKTFSAALIDLLNMSTNNDASAEHEENLYRTIHQILEMLSGSEPISTFEFIESGIVKSLVTYLSTGLDMRENVGNHNGANHFYSLEKRFESFAIQLLSLSDPILEDLPLSVIIQKLLSAISSVENFPVILSHVSKKRNSYSTVPYGQCLTYPCLRVRFVREEGETTLCDYCEDVLTVDPLSSVDAIEGFLWPKVTSTTKARCKKSSAKCMSHSPPPEASSEGNVPQLSESDSISSALREMQVDGVNLSNSELEEAVNARQTTLEENHEGDIPNGSVKQELRCSSEADIGMKAQYPASSSIKDDSGNLSFYLEGRQLDRALTLYQTILHQEMKADYGLFNCEKLWTQVYTVTYKRTLDPKESHLQNGCQFAQDSSVSDKVGTYWNFAPLFSRIFDSEFASDLDKSSPTYNILFLLKSLEHMIRFASHLMSRERIYAYVEGRIENFNNLKILAHAVPQNEFVSSKLTEKLEHQMRDPLAVSIGGVPSWCNQLMASCPFLFGFETRCKYFHLAAFGSLRGQPRLPSPGDSNSSGDRRPIAGGLVRKKFLVYRDRILASAAKMMDLHARHKVVLEVEYEEEVGTGLGPTLEFYTLVSHEFQKPGLGMWREGHSSSTSLGSLQNEDYGIVVSHFGLFPCPWSSTLSASDEILFFEVINKFVLLGQVVAKSLQDGRVLDLPLSKAFYKLILGQELSLYDIQSFDPELGRTLIEFKALVDRKSFLDSACGVNSTLGLDSCFRDTRIEDLYLDFTLPGYPDYTLTSGPDYNMVHMSNLEEYVALVVDATIHDGIFRQVEAFRSGFNQVFPIKHLQIFTEEELEHLLCGERDSWDSNELLDHAKFDHGYTASSPPVLNLLEIIQELDFNQRRAFLQFVTGAPRLPPGGLASLNPKLTIVRKHCSKWVDAELPSVMTCANYLKLPPYSTKEMMKRKLLYAITEGQGSFHLS